MKKKTIAIVIAGGILSASYAINVKAQENTTVDMKAKEVIQACSKMTQYDAQPTASQQNVTTSACPYHEDCPYDGNCQNHKNCRNQRECPQDRQFQHQHDRHHGN